MRALSAGPAAAMAMMVLAVSGCAGPGSPETALVQIVDNSESRAGAFEPATLVITVGTEVRWENTGSQVHTVTSDGTGTAAGSAAGNGVLEWDSGQLWPGETFAFRFEVAGEYVYWCTDHRDEQMLGTIRVEEP